MIYFISIFFPFIGLFMVKKPVSGYFNLVTHILILLGSSLYPTPFLIFPLWISIVLWSFFEISDFKNRKIGRQIIKQLSKNNSSKEYRDIIAYGPPSKFVSYNNNLADEGDSNSNLQHINRSLENPTPERMWFNKYLPKTNNEYLGKVDSYNSRVDNRYDSYNNNLVGVNNNQRVNYNQSPNSAQALRVEPELNNYNLRNQLNNQVQGNSLDYNSQRNFLLNNRYHMSNVDNSSKVANNAFRYNSQPQVQTQPQPEQRRVMPSRRMGVYSDYARRGIRR